MLINHLCTETSCVRACGHLPPCFRFVLLLLGRTSGVVDHLVFVAVFLDAPAEAEEDARARLVELLQGQRAVSGWWNRWLGWRAVLVAVKAAGNRQRSDRLCRQGL